MNTYFTTRINCPSCNSNDIKISYDISYTDANIVKYLAEFYGKQGGVEFEYLQNGRYTLITCNNCECTYQKEIPNDFLMEKLYEKWIDPKYIKTIEVNNYSLNHSLSYANEIPNIISHFDVLPGQLDFLDFGMGWGKWCMMAKAMGVINVFGTELSESRIEYAQNNAINVISYENIKDNKFDFINTDQVFEHIPNPLETLQYLQQSLKPNGIIRISVPNAKYIAEILNKMDWTLPKQSKCSVNVVAPLEHINGFKHITILKMADKLNMKQLYLKQKIKYNFENDRVVNPIRNIARILLKTMKNNKNNQTNETDVYLINHF